MTPEPKLEDQLNEDIAIQGAEDGEIGIPDNDDAADGTDEEEMEEAQEDAAEERKEGGYQ